MDAYMDRLGAYSPSGAGKYWAIGADEAEQLSAGSGSTSCLKQLVSARRQRLESMASPVRRVRDVDDAALTPKKLSKPLLSSKTMAFMAFSTSRAPEARKRGEFSA